MAQTGNVVAKQPDGANQVAVTLPGQYRALGRHLYAQKAYHDDFPEIYKEFNHLKTELAAAKAAAGASNGVLDPKAFELKINQVFVRLGKVAFEKHGEGCGPAELVRPIAVARASDASAKIGIAPSSVIPSRRSGAWRWVLLSVVLVVVVCVVGLVAFFKKSGSSSQISRSLVPAFHEQSTGGDPPAAVSSASVAGNVSDLSPAGRTTWRFDGPADKFDAVVCRLPTFAKQAIPETQKALIREACEWISKYKALGESSKNAYASEQEKRDLDARYSVWCEQFRSRLQKEGMRDWVFLVQREDRDGLLDLMFGSSIVKTRGNGVMISDADPYTDDHLLVMTVPGKFIGEGAREARGTVKGGQWIRATLSFVQTSSDEIDWDKRLHEEEEKLFKSWAASYLPEGGEGALTAQQRDGLKKQAADTAKGNIEQEKRKQKYIRQDATANIACDLPADGRPLSIHVFPNSIAVNHDGRPAYILESMTVLGDHYPPKTAVEPSDKGPRSAPDGPAYRSGPSTLVPLEKGSVLSNSQYQQQLAVMGLRLKRQMTKDEVASFMSRPTSKEKMVIDAQVVPADNRNNDLEIWTWEHTKDKVLAITFVNGKVSMAHVNGKVVLSD